MSETPNTQPQDPTILGAITAAEAQILADVTKPETDPTKLAIHEQLGGIVAEQGMTFALVTSTNEEGVESALHYVRIDTDAGTRVREENRERVGLPDPTEALAKIRTAEAEAAAEPESKAELPVDIEAIVKDFDKMLEPANLRYFAGDSIHGDFEAVAKEDTKKADMMGQLRSGAIKAILAPEQAVTVAKEGSKKLFEANRDEAQQLVNRFDTVVEGLQLEGRSFDAIAGELPGLQQGIGTLREAVQSGRPLEEYDLGVLRSLEYFSEGYATTLRKREAGMDDLQNATRTPAHMAEQLHDDLRRGVNRIEREATDVLLGSIDESRVEETIGAVQARGEQTVTDHQASTDKEYRNSVDTISDAAKKVENVSEKTQLLLRGLHALDDVRSVLPHTNMFVDTISTMSQYVRNLAYGGGMQSIASEWISQVEDGLRKIENGINEHAQTSQYVTRLSSEAREAYASLRTADFFVE